VRWALVENAKEGVDIEAPDATAVTGAGQTTRVSALIPR